MNSETPRTDELEQNLQNDDLSQDVKLILALRFAERLERENNELKKDLQNWIEKADFRLGLFEAKQEDYHNLLERMDVLKERLEASKE